MALNPGMKIVVVPEPTPVVRTWRERLFSRPWRPLKRFKTIEHPLWQPMKNGGDCYVAGDTIYVNERQFSELKKLPEMKVSFGGLPLCTSDTIKW